MSFAQYISIASELERPPPEPKPAIELAEIECSKCGRYAQVPASQLKINDRRCRECRNRTQRALRARKRTK